MDRGCGGGRSDLGIIIRSWALRMPDKKVAAPKDRHNTLSVARHSSLSERNKGTVNLSNPRAIFAGSPPRFTRSRVTYEAYVVSRTSTRPQVDSAHGGNASRVVRRGLPCCPAQATAVRGSPTLRRSPTTSTPRNHVRPPRGADTTGMARSAMMALWAPGLGGDLVITDPTRSRLLRFSARHTPAHHEFSNTLSDICW